MRVEPLLRVTGHVTECKTVEVPSRTDEKSGQTFDAYSYVECSIETLAAVKNQPVDNITVPLIVTDGVGGDLARTPAGTLVDIYVSAYSTWQRYRGRSFSVARHRFCGPVAVAAAA